MDIFENLEQRSYLYGIAITDGTMVFNKKTLVPVEFRIELSEKDEEQIVTLSNFIPESKIYRRIRKTNFSDNFTSCSLKVFRKEFCEKLIDLGYPVKEKTSFANIPNGAFDEKAFWRGVIDGDGSLGLRKSQGKRGMMPYLSLVTSSEYLKIGMCNLLNKVTGKDYSPNRNVRDNVYNITCAGNSAFKVSSYLYEGSNIAMPRKYSKYLEIKSFMEDI